MNATDISLDLTSSRQANLKGIAGPKTPLIVRCQTSATMESAELPRNCVKSLARPTEGAYEIRSQDKLRLEAEGEIGTSVPIGQ